MVCLALISLCLPLEMILVVAWILSGMEPTADLLWTSGCIGHMLPVYGGLTLWALERGFQSGLSEGLA